MRSITRALAPEVSSENVPAPALVTLGLSLGLTILLAAVLLVPLLANSGNTVKDIDLATVLTPDEVIARLAGAKIKAVPTTSAGMHQDVPETDVVITKAVVVTA